MKWLNQPITLLLFGSSGNNPKIGCDRYFKGWGPLPPFVVGGLLVPFWGVGSC